MKIQIKNSHKVIVWVAFLMALLVTTSFKVVENIERAENGHVAQIKADSLFIDIMVGDKIEALKKFITGWQEVRE